MIELSIVIPVYNEEKILLSLFSAFNSLLGRLQDRLLSYGGHGTIEILLINDGSADGTADIIKSHLGNDLPYRYISLSRNFGHQAAVSAGLSAARGKAVVIMDADLQDPPELIISMVEKWKHGYDSVYAVRRTRQATLFKKIAYKLFYRLHSLISDFPVQKDSGDFCLLDRKVVDVINNLPEKGKYVRGLRAWVGFKQISLEYDRIARTEGETKYTLINLIKLALQGIVSTSVKPLYLSGLFTIFTILIVIFLIFFVLITKAYIPKDIMPKGWASIMITMVFLNGVQLITIWMLSLYISRIFRETLSRPTYIIAYDSMVEKECQNKKDK